MPAALAVVGALALPGAATAAPKLKTTPSFAGSRLVVTVTSAKTFTARTRPRAVKVAAGAATYKLKAGHADRAQEHAGGPGRSARRSSPGSTRPRSGSASGRRRARSSSSGPRRRLRPRRPRAAQRPAAARPRPRRPTGGGTAPPATPGVTLTRDDAAGQRGARRGDLLLERVESGSVTMTYHRDLPLRQRGVPHPRRPTGTRSRARSATRPRGARARGRSPRRTRSPSAAAAWWS